jgi:hypothetical protein
MLVTSFWLKAKGIVPLYPWLLVFPQHPVSRLFLNTTHNFTKGYNTLSD